MLTREDYEQVKKFQTHPVDFFELILGVNSLEGYQARILNTIANNDRTAISACHDVGKSWTLARAVLWFCSVFPYSKVITTAPTFNQVQNILWSEIRSAYSRSKIPLGGKMNLTEWQLTKEGDWFAIGFTPRNELSGDSGQGTQSSFQGFHAPHILIVFDEATGIPHNIWTMCEGMLTSASVKFVAIGNPTSRASEFYKCFSSPDWAKVKLSCFDSPNLIANGITDIGKLKFEIETVASMNDSDAQARLATYKVVRPHLLTLRWVVSMGLPRKWGIEHPLFVSKVLGGFPKQGDGSLIPLEDVEEAQLRLYYPKPEDRKVIGVDVARFGSDLTVLTALHGRKFLGKKAMSKRDTMGVAGEVIAFANEIGGADVIVVDGTGVGGGVVDALNEAKNCSDPTLPRETDIREVQFGAACTDEDDKLKYGSVKARMFDLLAIDLKRSVDGLVLPNEDVYLDELPTLKYAYDSKGRKIMESKDDYKKRTGRRSPDHSDSLALANYGNYDEVGVGTFTEQFSGGYAKPFAAGLGSTKQW